MKLPPTLMHVRIRGEDGNFGIWLPLFLLLPLALVIFIILLPFILIAIIVLWPSGWGRRALLTLWIAPQLLYSLRGLKVDIKNEAQNVFISVV
jgi:hypothetical protein